jgi:hypothetical protein
MDRNREPAVREALDRWRDLRKKSGSVQAFFFGPRLA